MTTYSTREAAKLVGVHPVTLERWILAGKVRPSQRLEIGAVHHWRWTPSDILKARKYKLEQSGRWPKGARRG